MDILGSRLRTLRRRMRKTIKQVSRDMDIPMSTLGMYERGERKPSLERLRQLAEYYQVAADELLDISGVVNNELEELLANPRISLAARKMSSMTEKQQRQILKLIELMESSGDE